MRGKIIAIEGIDGSGKNTQANMLEAYLKDAGLKVKKLSFPMYENNFFGKEVGNYLNGHFGALDVVHPKLAAMLYAGDRYESKKIIMELLEQGFYIVCDRYVASNIAHQASKLTSDKHDDFIKWIKELEYNVYGMPVADLTLFLDVPPSISDGLVSNKGKRGYTEKVKDLHEEDVVYLKGVYSMFKKISSSEGWLNIECVNGVNMLDVEDVSVMVTGEVKSFFNI